MVALGPASPASDLRAHGLRRSVMPGPGPGRLDIVAELATGLTQE